MTGATKGLLFARFVKALAITKGDLLGAAAFAAGQRWTDSDRIAMTCKALIDASSTQDMVSAMQPINTDLSDYLRARTIVGRLTNLQRVPFRTRLLATTVGATAGFVGEGQPIPVTAAELTGAELLPLKVATIAVLTRELIQMSSPVADMLIAKELGAAITERMDRQFIDPSYTGVADVSPASITADATQLPSSGVTVAAVTADLTAMIETLIASNMSLETATFLMSPTTAVRLALMRDNGGALAFPSITATGGTIVGLPVVTSTALSAAGSPGEFNIALLVASEVAVADDGSSEISYSQQASLQLADDPATGAQPLISLYQHNLVAIRAIRACNWKARRTGAVAVLRNVAY